jgi:hypothetical protein
MRYVVMIGLIGISSLVAAPARAVVMCQKKSGAVFVRTACKKKETVLDPVALGLRGPAGPPGAPGDPGPPGPFPATLPSGKTIRGAYQASSQTFSATTVVVSDTQSFIYPLASVPTVTVIPLAGDPTDACPGSAADPRAAPGNLCIYAAAGVTGPMPLCVFDPSMNTGCSNSGTTGFSVITNAGEAFSIGTWAVTAP